MKRGGFWMTAVATGVAVLGLMTVGRAGLKSQGLLFLQGQMKIAAGDTDSGLRLLAEASSRPQMGASLTNPLETASQPAKAAQPEKPCRKLTAAESPNRTEQALLKVKPAPEPTLASLSTPMIPMPPVVNAPYTQDGMAYIPTMQREALRSQQAEIRRAQRIREAELKKALREISYKYRVANIPNAPEIRVQVQEDLGTWAQ